MKSNTKKSGFLSTLPGILTAAITANLLWGSAADADPVFGVVLPALFLGEGKSLNIPRCALAMVLVCLGVWIVNRPAEQPVAP